MVHSRPLELYAAGGETALSISRVLPTRRVATTGLRSRDRRERFGIDRLDVFDPDLRCRTEHRACGHRARGSRTGGEFAAGGLQRRAQVESAPSLVGRDRRCATHRETIRLAHGRHGQ